MPRIIGRISSFIKCTLAMAFIYREHEHQSGGGGGELNIKMLTRISGDRCMCPKMSIRSKMSIGVGQRYSCRELYKLVLRLRRVLILKFKGKAYPGENIYELRSSDIEYFKGSSCAQFCPS